MSLDVPQGGVQWRRRRTARRLRLHDVRLDAEHGFRTTFEAVHSEILLPDGAPGRWLDRAALWNEVEAVEGRSTPS